MAQEKDRIDITEDFYKEEKKRKWAERKQKAKQWCRDHLDLILAGGATLIGLAKAGGKLVDKTWGRRMDYRNKELKCYDNRLGRYWDLRRPLTNDDWLEIDRRKSRGERLGDILESLHALK